MSDKYIIRNCNTFNGYCNWCRDKQKHCKDITDCVLKQIVNICNNPMEVQTEVFPSDDYYRGEIDMSNAVLAKLNIQEVE